MSAAPDPVVGALDAAEKLAQQILIVATVPHLEDDAIALVAKVGSARREYGSLDKWGWGAMAIIFVVGAVLGALLLAVAM